VALSTAIAGMKSPLQLRSRAYERRKRTRCDGGYMADSSKRVSKLAGQQVSKSAKRRRSGASGPFFGEKTGFSGDFQRTNLAMRENQG